MSKIQLPPKNKNNSSIDNGESPIAQEKLIQAIINKGGSPAKDELIEDKVKNFNIPIMESDLNIITKLCDKRPKKLGKKIALSKVDWMLEAVQEKIEREKAKFKI